MSYTRPRLFARDAFTCSNPIAKKSAGGMLWSGICFGLIWRVAISVEEGKNCFDTTITQERKTRKWRDLPNAKQTSTPLSPLTLFKKAAAAYPDRTKLYLGGDGGEALGWSRGRSSEGRSLEEREDGDAWVRARLREIEKKGKEKRQREEK
ncbi:hypothetical protein CRG98_026249 [Punica granatum]|uniref:Uncharacterized protein n=1 Tax=Punica granatum TaxID=22663 RepID=A0A2I0JBR7_PUNGR|nr:hypothetical protein CRG98_026249 [Punica granatum]